MLEDYAMLVPHGAEYGERGVLGLHMCACDVLFEVAIMRLGRATAQ